MRKNSLTHLFTNRWVIWFLRFVLALVFIAACLPKMWHPHAFATAIFRYQILPYELINGFAIYLPWLECVTAVVLLFWPKGRMAALVILLAMLLVFTVAISASIFRGIDMACGCFSVNPEAGRIGWLNIGRNVLLILSCVWLGWFEYIKNKATASFVR